MGSVLLIAEAGAGTVLLLVDDAEDTGGIFLYDHQADGSGSDTWHRTVQDAKAQATYQFGVPPEAWVEASLISDPRLMAEIKIRSRGTN